MYNPRQVARDACEKVIVEALSEQPLPTADEVRQRLDQAYPFNIKSGFPFQAWATEYRTAAAFFMAASSVGTNLTYDEFREQNFGRHPS